MQSLTPAFTAGNISTRIEHFINLKFYKMIEVLSYVGESFVNEARQKRPEEGSFHDRTGNLRSSIGYIVAFDGQIANQDYEGTSEGQANARKVLNEVLQDNRSGLVLIVCAGMEYGAAVEAKGYDVISGSIPNAEKLLSYLKKQTGLV